MEDDGGRRVCETWHDAAMSHCSRPTTIFHDARAVETGVGSVGPDLIWLLEVVACGLAAMAGGEQPWVT